MNTWVIVWILGTSNWPSLVARFEQAILEAMEVDRLLDESPNREDISEKNKPFFGVPFTAKESVQIQGPKAWNAFAGYILV